MHQHLSGDGDSKGMNILKINYKLEVLFMIVKDVSLKINKLDNLLFFYIKINEEGRRENKISERKQGPIIKARGPCEKVIWGPPFPKIFKTKTTHVLY